MTEDVALPLWLEILRWDPWSEVSDDVAVAAILLDLGAVCGFNGGCGGFGDLGESGVCLWSVRPGVSGGDDSRGR